MFMDAFSSSSSDNSPTSSKKKIIGKKRPRSETEHEERASKRARTLFYFSRGDNTYKQGKISSNLNSIIQDDHLYTLKMERPKYQYAAILDRIPTKVVVPSLVIELVTCSTLRRVCKRDLQSALPTTLPWIDGLTNLSLVNKDDMAHVTFAFPSNYETYRFAQKLRLQIFACLPNGDQELLFLSVPLEIGAQRLSDFQSDLSHVIVPPCEYNCMFEVCYKIVLQNVRIFHLQKNSNTFPKISIPKQQNVFKIKKKPWNIAVIANMPHVVKHVSMLACKLNVPNLYTNVIIKNSKHNKLIHHDCYVT